MANILLLYSSVYGQTRKICERLQEVLAGLGDRAELQPIAACTKDPSNFDKIVIGASIRNGKHNPAVIEFIRANQALLEARPSGFFSVNLVARKPAKNKPETNPYVQAFLGKSPWQPRLVGVFAGDLNYPRYGTVDRNIIRFIMWLTKGPTDPKTKIEYTDWDEVRRFAEKISTLGPAPGH